MTTETPDNVGLVTLTYDISKKEGKLKFSNPVVKFENFDDISEYPDAMALVLKELAEGVKESLTQVPYETELPKFGFFIRFDKDTLYKTFKPN